MDYDLWTEAGRDAEAEAADARLTRAKVAAAGIWPFLAIAESEAEFDHRLAIAESSLQRTVEAGMLPAVKTALREDFVAMKTAANDAETSQYSSEKANGYTDTRDGFASGVGSYSGHGDEKMAHNPHHVYDSLGSAVKHLGDPRDDQQDSMLGSYEHCNSCDHVFNAHHPAARTGPSIHSETKCLNCGDTDYHEAAADVLADSHDPYDDHGPDYHGLDGDNYGDPYGKMDRHHESSKQASGPHGGLWDNLPGQHQVDPSVRGGAHNTVAPTAAVHNGHGQGDPCTSACFTPRDGKEAKVAAGGYPEEPRFQDGHKTEAHPSGLNVHTFDSTGQAYNQSQVSDKIKDGDVLSVPSEGVHGFLFGAWPVASHHGPNGPGEFHGTTNGMESLLKDEPGYHKSHEVASSLGQGENHAGPNFVKPKSDAYSWHEASLVTAEVKGGNPDHDHKWDFRNQCSCGASTSHCTCGKQGAKTAEAQSPCPNHEGQWYDKSTGGCSCGSNHNRWADSNNPGGQKKGSLEFFHAGLGRWVAAPPGDGVPEQGPNTGQTGFPPVATDPMNPINQMFPMQPTGWGQPQLPQDLNAATGQPVQYGTTGSRLPFALAAEDPFGSDNPMHGANPFNSENNGHADMGVTPATTPPRQIPGGGSGMEVDTVTDAGPSDEAGKNQPPPPATTAGVVRERPTNDNPNGIADEYVSNNYDTPLKMAPRQSPEDRGINSPTVPDDRIPEASSDIPRPGDNEESEGEEKQSRVKQGFSAREDGRAMYPVICHACNRTGSVERVTASLRCVCGSADLDLWDGEPTRPTASLSPSLSFLDYMKTALVDPAQGPNPMQNGLIGPRPCPACRGTGTSMEAGGVCRYCDGAGKIQPYGAAEPAPAVAGHYNENPGKTAAPRGKRPKQNGEFDVEQHIRDTTRGYGDRLPENETVRPSTKRKDHSMGVAPAYRPHFDYDHNTPKKPFETGHRCPGCGHGVTYLTPDYKGDSWLTCPKEGPLINVDRGAGTTFDPEAPPEDWKPSSRSYKAPEAGEKTALKKPKALLIAEGVKQTNPGIRGLAAYRIAQRTVQRFPGVTAR